MEAIWRAWRDQGEPRRSRGEEIHEPTDTGVDQRPIGGESGRARGDEGEADARHLVSSDWGVSRKHDDSQHGKERRNAQWRHPE